MKYVYKGIEPCRIDANLVQAGDEYEFADNPGPRGEGKVEAARVAR